MALTNKEKTEPNRVKTQMILRLLEATNAQIDISKCGDKKYLSTLEKSQTDRVKKITFSKGDIASIEFTPLVDLASTAANIAGVKENNQAVKAEAEIKNKNMKQNQLRILTEPKEKKPKVDNAYTAQGDNSSEKPKIEDFTKNIENLKNSANAK